MLFTATRFPPTTVSSMARSAATIRWTPSSSSESTFPGCRIQVRPVGMFVMRDEKGQDEKVLCVPLRDPAWSHVQELSDLRPTLLAEIEHFFSVYKDWRTSRRRQTVSDRATTLTVIEEAPRSRQE